jgi:FtsP/CotA-like multicopper oxidase with cupredoxin domain
MTITRRSLLNLAALASAMSTIPRLARAVEQATDYTLRIATGLVELGPDHIVSTTLYNGQFPGPLLRFKEGQRVVDDLQRHRYPGTGSLARPDDPERRRWRGSEEGTPFVPAHGMRRMSFVPKPSGFRFYHTHVVGRGDLNRGTYTGQAGPVYIEPKNNPGAYDREVFLVLKEFRASFSRGGDMAMDFPRWRSDQGIAADGKARR